MVKWHGIFAGLTLLFFTACIRNTNIGFNSNDTPLEVHADSVRINLELKKPKKMNKDQVVYLYQKENSAITLLDSISISENVKKDSVLKVAIPFNIITEGSHIVLGRKELNKFRSLKGIDSMECCITTSQLIEPDFRLILSEKKDIKSPLKLITQFNFPINKSEINDKDLSNEDLQLITDFLQTKDTISKITILTSGSPEGSEKFNDSLTSQRANSLVSWLNSTLAKAGHPNPSAITDSIKIIKKEEDWEGFVQMIDSIKLEPAKKSAIKEIAKKDLSYEQKEAGIRTLLGGKIDKVEKALAPLRKATLIIEAGGKVRRDTELDSIAVSYLKDPDDINLEKVFSKEEWIYTIGRIKGVEGKKTLMAAYYKTFPNDYTIFNDLGVLSLSEDSTCPQIKVCDNGAFSEPVLEKSSKSTIKTSEKSKAFAALPDSSREGEPENYDFIYEAGKEEIESTSAGLDSALAFFEKANGEDPGSHETTCNIACVYSLQGRYNAAIGYFTKSLKAKETSESHYNLALVYSLAGKYDQSLKELDNVKEEAVKNYYNSGLIRILNKDYTGANKDLEKQLSLMPEDAKTIYALAINSARQGKLKEVEKHLSKVCSLNKDLCFKSKSDKEFNKLNK